MLQVHGLCRLMHKKNTSKDCDRRDNNNNNNNNNNNKLTTKTYLQLISLKKKKFQSKHYLQVISQAPVHFD